MIQTLLIALGLRTNCCAAKVDAWHANKLYCAGCQHVVANI